MWSFYLLICKDDFDVVKVHIFKVNWFGTMNVASHMVRWNQISSCRKVDWKKKWEESNKKFTPVRLKTTVCDVHRHWNGKKIHSHTYIIIRIEKNLIASCWVNPLMLTEFGTLCVSFERITCWDWLLFQLSRTHDEWIKPLTSRLPVIGLNSVYANYRTMHILYTLFKWIWRTIFPIYR